MHPSSLCLDEFKALRVEVLLHVAFRIGRVVPLLPLLLLGGGILSLLGFFFLWLNGINVSFGVVGS